MRFLCKLGWHAWSSHVEQVRDAITCRWTCPCGAQRMFLRMTWLLYWRDLDKAGRLEMGKWGRRSTDAMIVALGLETMKGAAKQAKEAKEAQTP